MSWLVAGAHLQQAKPPIIVKLVEPPKDPTGGLADVLIGALGLSGAITLAAVLLGVLLGAVTFWIRRPRY